MKSKLNLILVLCMCFVYANAQNDTKEDAKAFYTQGLEKAQAGQFEEAIALFGKSIELQPEDYFAWYNRGIARNRLRYYEAALTDFEQTIKLAPDYKKGHLNLGTTKKRLTDYDGALVAYSAAIKLDPNYADAYYNRGLVYEMLRKKDLACSDFNKAKQFGMKENAQKKIEKCADTTSNKVHPIIRLTKTATDDKYGFTSEKPIKVGFGIDGGPANQRAYLDLLRDKQGKSLIYKRLGGCCDYKSDNGFLGMAQLDKYEITYLNEKGEEKTATVYLSFYDYEEPQILAGFKTVGQR